MTTTGASPTADQEQSRRSKCSIFRESYLSLFEHPEHEAALRLLDDLFLDLTFEGRRVLLERSGGNIWRCDVRGAIGDLRQAADKLADVARDLDEAGGDGRHTARVMLAIADAAGEVEPIAARLDAALDAYLATPPAE